MHAHASPNDQLNPQLAGTNIGLSMSDNADRTQRGFSQIHQSTFMYEVARTLFRFGASISYGGHLRNEGFTVTSLQHLIDERQTAIDDQGIKSYVAWPLYCRSPNSKDEVQDDFLRFADIVMTDPPTNLPPRISKNDFLEPKPIRDRFYWFRSLTEMRRRMNSEIHARVVMGGKLNGYIGRYPGVAEEVLIALASETPVYICGGFGGASGALARLFLGESVKELEAAFQYGDSQYAASASYYEALASDTLGRDMDAATQFDRFVRYAVDYSLLCEFFRAIGTKGLNNGLSHDENMVLFETPSLDEMRMLILSGLTRLFARPEGNPLPVPDVHSNSKLATSKSAFMMAVQSAGLPRSPLIDNWQRPQVVSTDDLIALEDEIFPHLSDRYSEVRRLIISRHSSLGFLEQFSTISNGRSLLSLDLAALVWQPVPSARHPVVTFLDELAKAEPAIESGTTVRSYLSAGVRGGSSGRCEERGATSRIMQCTPDKVIWFVQASSADGKETSEGSAVAIRLRRKEGDQLPKTYLLTCGHVLRGTSADGKVGFGRVLTNILVWAPGTGFNKDQSKAAKINPYIRWVPDVDVPTEERRNAAEDWVLVDILNPQSSAAAWAVSTWAGTIDTGPYSIWGYPGGEGGFTYGVVTPAQTREPFPLRDPLYSGALGVIQLTGDGTRPGNSGGGVFTTKTGLFAGIHRARDDATLQLHAVSAQHIARRLSEMGFEVTDAA